MVGRGRVPPHSQFLDRNRNAAWIAVARDIFAPRPSLFILIGERYVLVGEEAGEAKAALFPPPHHDLTLGQRLGINSWIQIQSSSEDNYLYSFDHSVMPGLIKK